MCVIYCHKSQVRNIQNRYLLNVGRQMLCTYIYASQVCITGAYGYESLERLQEVCVWHNMLNVNNVMGVTYHESTIIFNSWVSILKRAHNMYMFSHI